MLAYALLGLGGVMLYFGAEWLVGGASRLAASMRVPELIIGLTVVAYGTSAPEVIVGVQAARAGHGDVALGNVIGSNIANLGLILGAAVLVSPPLIDGALRRRELPVLLASTFALPLVLLDGNVARWEGVVLVACALAYTAWMVRSSRASVREAAADVVDTARAAEAASGGVAAASSPVATSRLTQVGISALGLGTLLAGGHLFVTNATILAMRWGMSERLVGLTIVAIGTSLPELVTSIIAARRGKADLAVGNVVGSNIFNVLLCLGLASTSAPIESRAATFLVDLVALGLFTGAGLVFLRSARRMTRAEGALLVAGYVGYLGYSAVR